MCIMTAPTRKALGKRIRMLRKANKLSQQKFALMVGVERSYLSKLEAGKRNPSIDCIEKIANGLDVTLSELFLNIEAEALRDSTHAGNCANREVRYRLSRFDSD